jgi:hypothetical protein
MSGTASIGREARASASRDVSAVYTVYGPARARAPPYWRVPVVRGAGQAIGCRVFERVASPPTESGAGLAEQLERSTYMAPRQAAAFLKTVIEPVVEVCDLDTKCLVTWLRLIDI